MENLTIIWLPKAKIQLYDISLYWLEKTQSESYILKLEAEIAKICKILEYNPRIGLIVENRERVFTLHPENKKLFSKKSRGE